jgi:uncharacterized protein YabN with tetrapyrrole methylase and pyrophosphatase domain
MNIFTRLTELEQKASEYGFQWSDSLQIIDQIKSEIREVEENLKKNMDKNHLQEEIGDLIHACFSLCVFHKFNAQETLDASLNKFDKRFSEVQKISQEKGFDNLRDKSFSELMYLWDLAKKRVG